MKQLVHTAQMPHCCTDYSCQLTHCFLWPVVFFMVAYCW